MHQGPAALGAAAYTRLYEAEYPRLVAYARTLTGNPWTAGDLVAEAHYRVWRRVRTGPPIGADAAPAELTSAVRGLSAAASSWGPPQRASYLEPLVEVLGELPQRWVTALWLAEVDGLAPEGVARRLGSHADGAAALVERGRDSLRQEYLRAQPGAPASAACGAYWERMPSHVQGVDTPQQAEQIAVHIEGCQDCRARMEQLVAADDRLPALTGPALLALLDRGAATWLAPLAAVGGAAAAVAATRTLPFGGAHASAAGGTLVSTRRSVRHLMRGQVRQAGPVAATVAGVGVLLIASAAVAAGLALTDGDPAEPGQPAAASVPSHPGGAGVPPQGHSSSGSSETSGTSPRKPDELRSDAAREASRNRPSKGAPVGQSPSDVPSSAVAPSTSASSSAEPSSPSSSSPSSRPTSPSSSPSSPSGEPSDPSAPSPTDDRTDGPTGEPTDGDTAQPSRPGEPSGTTSTKPTAEPTASSGDSSKDCVSLVVRVCVDDNR
ncbi:RNA polymerase sigma factor [Streptomyces coffeae]|uniref:Sigma-70 family RNA polymerase sigma factor n=1 Tax=Streptomyces coffeae TaxID=621382 RepID=A0ABS1NLR5_9ACTN|nr:sigma-70 family RNA polymerase sigma factor [Streptomyces coffeae]MBL1100933.1 sigma-70 family RNA polymerase sigma factor [Streptomyces coffeae]